MTWAHFSTRRSNRRLVDSTIGAISDLVDAADLHLRVHEAEYKPHRRANKSEAQSSRVLREAIERAKAFRSCLPLD